MSRNKGNAILYLEAELSAAEAYAVGDAAEDIPLWRVAQHCYAPANVRPEVKQAAGKDRLCVAAKRQQRGLLEIARKVTHNGSRHCSMCSRSTVHVGDPDLLWA